MGKRVDWTAYEQGQVYAATVDLLKNRKVSLPVEPPGKEFLQAIRDAQVSLPENRRRPLASIDTVTGDLAKRFVDNGVIRKDHQESYRRGWNKKQRKVEAQEVDPRDEKIQTLEIMLHTTESKVEELEHHIEALKKELEYWKNQPGPMEVIQKWVAQTLAMALTSAEDAKKPTAVRFEERALKEPIPDFERERRKDPTPTPGTGDLRPKIAVVAEFNNDAEMTNIHDHVKDVAQVRYLTSLSRLDHLNHFASTDGKVIVWTDRLPHSWKDKIEKQGVRYQYCNGTPNAVISCIRKAAGAE